MVLDAMKFLFGMIDFYLGVTIYNLLIKSGNKVLKLLAGVIRKILLKFIRCLCGKVSGTGMVNQHMRYALATSKENLKVGRDRLYDTIHYFSY